MQQVKGDALQRLASIALILGGILTLAVNAAFPRADDPAPSVKRHELCRQ